jgi:ribosome maturation factor RimP
MANDITTLQALIEPSITALGYELLGCVYLPQGRRGLLRIYIDNAQGINVDDCEKVSRQVSAILDVEDPIAGAYTLEVSSPGLNRPLFKLAHFAKYVGANVNIRLHVPLNNRRQFRGLLQAVVADKVVVRIDEQVFELPFSSIARANVDEEISVPNSKKN